jgi:hypothetical protein
VGPRALPLDGRDELRKALYANGFVSADVRAADEHSTTRRNDPGARVINTVEAHSCLGRQCPIFRIARRRARFTALFGTPKTPLESVNICHLKELMSLSLCVKSRWTLPGFATKPGHFR